ncbi:MAG: hypothetical protein WCV88_00930 [Patescibacteria group bacterium]|jgi:hypothetical protein
MMTAYQRLVLFGYPVAVLVNTAAWLLIFLAVDRMNPIIVLHYNIYFGPDIFGAWTDLFVLPGLGLGLIVLDFILTTWLWRKDRFLAYVATVGAVAAQATILVSVYLMVLINRT